MLMIPSFHALCQVKIPNNNECPRDDNSLASLEMPYLRPGRESASPLSKPGVGSTRRSSNHNVTEWVGARDEYKQQAMN